MAGPSVRYGRSGSDLAFVGNSKVVKVTAKGQVTIPKAICDLLGIEPGSKVTFTLAEDGRVTLSKCDEHPASRAQPSRFAALRGSSNSSMSTDEIMSLMRGEN
ncbi:MAG: AbrB/MazE/SpoVT family DNA-binding domain-containing protein [Acetobacteraceae bacterium]|jgi:antitoxin PrlF|nr:AbrB/MazE/SpoVT family DNA-binding domain-containing protein [Acetobacteraceae bacterium]